MKIREDIARVARLLIGAPYRWGGDAAYTPQGEPLGYDCSGLVIDVLQALDILPKGDWTAQQLAGKFQETFSPQPGDLVFYGTDKKIVHVCIFLGANSQPRGSSLGAMCIGANGGGPSTTTLEAAKARGARVKVVKVDYRKDCVGFRNVLAPTTAAALPAFTPPTNGAPR